MSLLNYLANILGHCVLSLSLTYALRIIIKQLNIVQKITDLNIYYKRQYNVVNVNIFHIQMGVSAVAFPSYLMTLNFNYDPLLVVFAYVCLLSLL